MAEESIISVPSLVSLPVDVLIEIGEFLSPRDLLAVSGVCRYLRSGFNNNSLWRKYTAGGRISQGLENTQSLVEPKFELPCGTSLEALCEHRYHFLKQSRLLSNLRSSKYVEHSIEFNGFLSEFETYKLNCRDISYSGKFLFCIGYEGDDTEIIKVFDIEISPKLILTVKFENHSPSYCIVIWLKVLGDKLIVRRDEWFDVYAIKLPESLDILYSINVNTLQTQSLNQTLIIGRYLFVENLTANVVHIWDLSNGDQCNDIRPKIHGPDFKMLGYSQNERFVIMSVGMFVGEPSNPYLFVYDIELQDFSPFKPVLSENAFKCYECNGLVDSDHVVILNERSNLNYSVFVFDHRSSTLVVEKSHLVTRRIEDAKIVDGYLVLPSLVSVVVMDLKSLQTVWELQLDTVRSLLYEFPVISMGSMEVLCVSSLSSIIVIHKPCGVEMWDFHTKRKLVVLSEEGNLAMNNTCSKLIFCDFQNLKIFSFW